MFCHEPVPDPGLAERPLPVEQEQVNSALFIIHRLRLRIRVGWTDLAPGQKGHPQEDVHVYCPKKLKAAGGFMCVNGRRWYPHYFVWDSLCFALTGG